MKSHALVFLCLAVFTQSLYGQQNQPTTYLGSHYAIQEGHRLSGLSIASAIHELRIDFIAGGGKSFKPGTEGASSMMGLRWKSSPGDSSDVKKMIVFKSSLFSPRPHKPYPSFYHGRFEIPTGQQPAPPPNDKWSATGALMAGGAPHVVCNIYRISNPAVSQDCDKITVVGFENHELSSEKTRYFEISSLDPQGFIGNYLWVYNKLVDCAPGVNPNGSLVVQRDLYTKVLAEGAGGLAHPPFTDPVEVVSAIPTHGCVNGGGCTHMIEREFYLNVKQQCRPMMVLLDWKQKDLGQQDSQDKWAKIYNDIRTHEGIHMQDYFEFLKEPFWKEWSQNRYVVQVCFGGQTINENGITYTAEQYAQVIIEELKERYKEEYGNKVFYNNAVRMLLANEATDAEMKAAGAKIGGILEAYFLKTLELENGERIIEIIREDGSPAHTLAPGWGADELEPLNSPNKL